MTKLIYAFFAVALCLGPLRAEAKEQTDPGPPEIQRDYVSELAEQLDLSPEQTTKIKAEVDPARDALKRRWQRIKGLQKRIKEESKAMREEMAKTSEAVRSHLTLEQKEKYDMMRMRNKMRREQRRGRRLREKRMKGGGRFPPEHWREGREGRDLPPELREHIERRRNRYRGERGQQRDVPPPEEWNDRRSLHEGGPRRGMDDRDDQAPEFRDVPGSRNREKLPRDPLYEEEPIDTRPLPPEVFEENQPWPGMGGR